jgi:hypothetical protein
VPVQGICRSPTAQNPLQSQCLGGVGGDEHLLLLIATEGPGPIGLTPGAAWPSDGLDIMITEGVPVACHGRPRAGNEWLIVGAQVTCDSRCENGPILDDQSLSMRNVLYRPGAAVEKGAVPGHQLHAAG